MFVDGVSADGPRALAFCQALAFWQSSITKTNEAHLWSLFWRFDEMLIEGDEVSQRR